MTVVVAGRANGVVSTPRQARVSPVAKLLAEIQKTLLAPMKEAMATPSDAIRLGLHEREKTWSADRLLEPNNAGEHEVQDAHALLNRLPEPEELIPAIAAAEAILATPPDMPKARTLIGLMLDSYPNASPHAPESYVEVLIHHAMHESFPPHAIGAACDETVSTSKFLPAPAEFLTTCRNKHGGVLSRLRALKDAVAVRERVDAALSAAIDVRDADLRPEQLENGERGQWPFEVWRAKIAAREAEAQAVGRAADEARRAEREAFAESLRGLPREEQARRLREDAERTPMAW